MTTHGTLRGLADIPPLPDRPADWDDHAWLALARSAAPLARDGYGTVIAFSLSHLRRFHDDRVSRQMETDIARLMGLRDGPVWDLMARSLLFSNGAAHRRRRTPLARSFARPVIAALRPAVRARCEALIRPLVGTGPVDVTAAVSGPLPAGVVAALIGAPEADTKEFAARVYSAIRALSPCRPEVLEEASADMAALATYCAGLLADRDRRAAPDFLDALLVKAGDTLDAPELRAQLLSLVLAGSDTTRGALTATLSLLLEHPDSWRALVADPERRADGAVAEGLRMEPVIGSLGRVLTVPLAVEGYLLPAGTIAAGAMATALRDPAVYAAPDRFDIARADHPQWHPVFGSGVHRCLGEALARMELAEALKAFARLAPRSRLAGPPARLRGLGATRRVPPLTVELIG